MKSKASLVLMEQLVMILVFAVAASICLQVFVRSDQISRETALRDDAVILAQNCAEAVKKCGGDLEDTAALLGGTAKDGVLTFTRDGLFVEVALLHSEVPGLGTARITVRQAETGADLFSLTTGWQEVNG